MSDDGRPHGRVVGSLRLTDGSGVVRIEDRYRTSVDDLWEALTDPDRLARWYGEVRGDLRPGGEFTTYLAGPDIEAVGRVEVCEPPRRLLLHTRETEESYRRGRGAPPFDQTIEATLDADGDEVVLVLEIRGLPLDRLASYGTGWHIHVEHLAGHVAGRALSGTESRWLELLPSYEAHAAAITG